MRLVPLFPPAARAALLLLPLAFSATFAADTASTAPMPATNPLLQPSTLPLQFPRFDLIKDEHFAPAFEAGMAEESREVDAIANASAAPTFDNTIVALNRSGRTLDRVDRIFSNLAGANTNPALQAIEREMAPKLAAHNDAIHLNAKLFARVSAVYNQRAQLGLDPESLRLVERTYKDFVRAGAQLSDADKVHLKQMNAQLAELQTTFSQNVLKEKNASSVAVASRDELAGMSEAEIAATQAAAKADGHAGEFVIRLQNTTGQPPLTDLEDRPLREKIMAASLARGSHGGDYDNRATVARIVLLRAQRANLLGYPTHAAYQLEDQTAHDVGTVNKLLADLAPPAVANARREAADIQQIIDRDKGGFQVTAADWDFYAEKVRAARYAFDESQLKPYFELNRVLTDGVFYAAHRLYGLTFKERKDLPVYQPDVRVFEVHDADGSLLAFFIGDYYARPSKRGGAWMNAYVAQSTLLGTQAVVANHLNIPKPSDGQPTLLTFDEVTTMFHEFGHALHGMFSHVKYPRFSGTQVPRDFVEYPSQVNEMWAKWPEVLKHYARHYQTGEPMPPELLEKLLATQKFNQGYATTEYLAASILDQAWHQITPAQAPAADGVLAFEATALKKAGVDFAPVPPRYRTTYFSHVFENGYSAGYYSYIWAEVLDADSVEWFKQHGGLTRENGDHFRATLLSRGGSVDAMKLFHDFTGRDPYVEPLLKRRGLEPVTATKTE
ncbi:M3 family metallopeptidase [Horticoccus luteus]|uniref:Dipeptidyl carboxypeptidase n=1 Tax=Horticoccus luteus TaxID=2862869 RepID=A0A8F9TUN6_9BACT|nr:M3 family metallopeptidase [Horticoccus luteus]QYM78440.1 M3 family metallopeptidase [Horticoccus luteus]